MADHSIAIPFIFHFAAGISGKSLSLPLEKQFEKARLTGWSDDPDDPGGATMIDVTIGAYADYRIRNSRSKPSKADLRAITFPEWADILKTMYWDRVRGDEIQSQGVANILLDWVWASGPGSISGAQRLVGVAPDGIVGPLTVKAINGADHEALFEKIRGERERRYRRCRGAWKYLKGWLRRLNAIRPDGTFNLPY